MANVVESGDNHHPALDGRRRIAALEALLALEALELCAWRVLVAACVRKASPAAARHSHTFTRSATKKTTQHTKEKTEERTTNVTD